jgi:uncharacterized protein YecT (DUF1311 family)
MILALLFFCAFSVIAKDLPDEQRCFPPPSTPPGAKLKTSELIECLSNIQKTVETELNERYQASTTPITVPPRMIANLRKSQRLWISYRDAVCKAQGDLRHEAGKFRISLCIIKITKERIADIEAFYTITR